MKNAFSSARLLMKPCSSAIHIISDFAACLPFCNIMNTSMQASFHITSSSFLPLSRFFHSVCQHQNPDDRNVVYSRIGCRPAECSRCCGLLWLRVARCHLPLAAMLPTLTPCVTKQHRVSEKETKDYFWSLFITSLILYATSCSTVCAAAC